MIILPYLINLMNGQWMISNKDFWMRKKLVIFYSCKHNCLEMDLEY
jgi:hypothetical protein